MSWLIARLSGRAPYVGSKPSFATSANADVAGATGRLSLDGFGNVLRQPSWSRFSGGVPVPLADGAR